MKCPQIKEIILTDYIDGEGSADVRKQIEQHVSGCQECREFLTASRQLIEQPFVQSQPTFEGKEKVWQNIQAQIEEERTSSVRPAFLENFIQGFKILFAVPRTGIVFSGVIIALLTAAVYFRSFSEPQMNRYAGEKTQLISDVADELSNSDDEEESYGTAIESYFL